MDKAAGSRARLVVTEARNETKVATLPTPVRTKTCRLDSTKTKLSTGWTFSNSITKGSSDPFPFCHCPLIMPRQSCVQVQESSEFHGQGDCHLDYQQSHAQIQKSCHFHIRADRPWPSAISNLGHRIPDRKAVALRQSMALNSCRTIPEFRLGQVIHSTGCPIKERWKGSHHAETPPVKPLKELD